MRAAVHDGSHLTQRAAARLSGKNTQPAHFRVLQVVVKILEGGTAIANARHPSEERDYNSSVADACKRAVLPAEPSQFWLAAPLTEEVQEGIDRSTSPDEIRNGQFSSHGKGLVRSNGVTGCPSAVTLKQR